MFLAPFRSVGVKLAASSHGVTDERLLHVADVAALDEAADRRVAVIVVDVDVSLRHVFTERSQRRQGRRRLFLISCNQIGFKESETTNKKLFSSSQPMKLQLRVFLQLE